MCLLALLKALPLVLALLSHALALPHCVLCMLLSGLWVCRTSGEGQGPALAPLLLLLILRETEPSICRGLMRLILLPFHQ